MFGTKYPNYGGTYFDTITGRLPRFVGCVWNAGDVFMKLEIPKFLGITKNVTLK